MGRRGGPGIENADYVAFAKRILKAMQKRAITDGDIEVLADMVAIHDDMGRMIKETVDALREPPNNYSWAEIGKATGLTRQGAQQRWGRE